MTLDIRPVRPDELPFCYDAAKKSLRFSREYIEKSNFKAYGEINPAVNRLLPRCEVLVAADRGQLAGFIAFLTGENELVVAYLYVKKDFRRDGVAKSLLATAIERSGVDVETADLRYVFPTSRFAALAEAYGFDLLEGGV